MAQPIGLISHFKYIQYIIKSVFIVPHIRDSDGDNDSNNNSHRDNNYRYNLMRI